METLSILLIAVLIIVVIQNSGFFDGPSI